MADRPLQLLQPAGIADAGTNVAKPARADLLSRRAAVFRGPSFGVRGCDALFPLGGATSHVATILARNRLDVAAA